MFEEVTSSYGASFINSLGHIKNIDVLEETTGKIIKFYSDFDNIKNPFPVVVKLDKENN